MSMLIFTLCVYLLLYTPKSQSNHDSLYNLNILHHNDFHAHFEAGTPRSTPCRPDRPCVGGFPRLYAAVKQLRDNNSIVLNAGDTFQGTPWYNRFKWNLTQQVMNLLPHDAHTLGNHEFDDGVGGMIPYMRSLLAPIVVANMDTSAIPSMKELYNKSVVIDKNGRKIGIIGVVISSIAQIGNVGNLTFSDEVAAVSAEADRLHSEGVDIIIVLSHSGLYTDKNIARKGSRHIDVIVGGHTHALLYNGIHPDNLEVTGEYPIVIQRDNGHKILIVQSMCFCRFLGHLKLKFDKNGEIVSYDGNSIYLDASIEEDKGVLEFLSPYMSEIEYLKVDTLGVIDVFLEIENCTCRECLLGNFVCDAYADLYMESLANGTKSRPICLANIGGLRSPIADGPVTLNDLKNTLPFENDMVTLNLRGEHVLAALEHSLSKWRFDIAKCDDYMLQVSGLHVVYNVSRPVYHRVVSVKVLCQHCDDPQYVPLNTNETYALVTNNFLASGGDGYTMVRDHSMNLRTRESDTDALALHIGRNSPITSHYDQRITVQF